MKKVLVVLFSPVLFLFALFGGLFTGAWIGCGRLGKQRRRRSLGDG